MLHTIKYQVACKLMQNFFVHIETCDSSAIIRIHSRNLQLLSPYNVTSYANVEKPEYLSIEIFPGLY